MAANHLITQHPSLLLMVTRFKSLAGLAPNHLITQHPSLLLNRRARLDLTYFYYWRMTYHEITSIQRCFENGQGKNR